jgi:hypothetical protein
MNRLIRLTHIFHCGPFSPELLKELTTTEIGERIGEFFGLDGPVVGPFAKQTFDLVFHYIDFDDSGTIDAGELR